MTLYIIYLFTAASIILICIGLFYAPKTPTKRLPLAQDENKKEKRPTRFVNLLVLPFTGKILEKLKLYEKIKTRLDAAHTKLTPEAFFNLKLLLMLCLAMLTVSISKKIDPLALLAPLILGYIVPDILLNAKIFRRREKVVFCLPETVDLIGLCVEAGLDFTSALKWIVEKTASNPMTEELVLLLEEIKWGKTRAQALKDMSRRINTPEIKSFVQTLVQAERMGTPVADAFRIISEDTREMRFHRGERMALKAPLKILIPLIFCILPVIAITIGGPIILQFMQQNILKGM